MPPLLDQRAGLSLQNVFFFGAASDSLMLALALLTSAHAAVSQQEPTIGPVDPDYAYASAEAVERWHDMKFGLRIHWGLYSAQGIGQESWPLFVPCVAGNASSSCVTTDPALPGPSATAYWLDRLCGKGYACTDARLRVHACS